MITAFPKLVCYSPADVPNPPADRKNMTASAVSQRVVACLDARGRGVLTEQPTPDLTPGCVRLRVTATMVSPGTMKESEKDRT